MAKKFDIEVAEKLSTTLYNTADKMESETQNIQDKFKVLGETFKDRAYSEFQGELNAADKTMAAIISDMRALSRAVAEYKNKMNDLL